MTKEDHSLCFLKEYKDEDGLISTNVIHRGNSNTLFLDGQAVETPYEIESIVEFLKSNDDLWSITKLKIQKKREGTWSSSGAPIIGVPFSKGIERIIQGKIEGYSLFSLDNYSEDGIPKGSLFAYYEKRSDEINFQLWEIVLPFDISTYYIHGIYNLKNHLFSHFDGAMIDLDEHTKKKLLYSPYIPNKKFDYKKLFRLDGKISLDNAIKLMDCYLPIEALSLEYGIKEKSI